MSPRKRADRLKILPGIWRDRDGYTAIVHVTGGGFREKRFPIGQPITDVQDWRERERAKLLAIAERGSAPGTFARDAVRYLKAFTATLASAKARRIEIMAWVRAFGERRRSSIRTEDVARVRAQWLTELQDQPRGIVPKVLSPKTVNNRTDSLRAMYHALDGKRGWTPVDDLSPLPVHRTPIVRIDDALILRVDAQLQAHERHGFLKDQKTRARYRLLMTTGRRPSEIMRTEPADVDLMRRVWLPRDGKGGFTPGIYLNDDMMAAWRFFIAADAWGKFSTNSFARVLRSAGWPRGLRPYQARHTIGIAMSEMGVELDDVGAMLGHKRRETTRRHYVPVLNSRLQRASELIDGRFDRWQQGPAAAPLDRRGAKPNAKPGAKQPEILRMKTPRRVTKRKAG